MNFVYNITTDANTAATAKKKTVVDLFQGTIVKVEIQFPPGPSGLLHCHINRALHQVWPANPDEDYVGDDQVISIPDKHPLISEPYDLEIYTWNLDDTYDHLLIVRVDIFPAEESITLSYDELAALASLSEL